MAWKSKQRHDDARLLHETSVTTSAQSLAVLFILSSLNRLMGSLGSHRMLCRGPTHASRPNTASGDCAGKC